MMYARTKSVAAILVVSCWVGAAAAQEAAKTAPANAARRPDAAARRKEMDEAFERFLKETDEKLDRRIKGLKGFFDERKANAPHFASTLLCTSAKLHTAGSLFEKLSSKWNELFAGPAEDFVIPPSPDSFTLYVRQCFRDDLLDPAKVRMAVDEAVDGFKGDVIEAEGRLLVALKLDVPDGIGWAPLNLVPELRVLGRGEAIADEAAGDAVNDLNADLAKFVVSTFVGNKLADGVTPRDASPAGRLARNLAVGVATDMALDSGVRAAGYDPQDKIASKVGAGIDQIRDLLIDGDRSLEKTTRLVATFQTQHPDAAVRLACERANEALKRVANLGVCQRLERLRNRRSWELWKEAAARLIGPEAAASPLMMFEPLDAEKSSPPEQIIRWAEQIVATGGGSR